MEKQIFSIPNISCSHCVMSIKNKFLEATASYTRSPTHGTKQCLRCNEQLSSL